MVKEFTCPFPNCDKSVKTEFNMKKHMVTQKHEKFFEINISLDPKNDNWIKMYKFRIREKIKMDQIGVYECNFCENRSNNFVRRDNYFSHIVNNHAKNIRYEINENKHTFEQKLPRKKPKHKPVRAKKGNFMRILDSYGSVNDHIESVFPSEGEIRIELKMKQFELCCDGMVHYSSCHYTIIEDTKSNIWKASRQIRSVAKAIKTRQHKVRMQIIVAKKIGTGKSKTYTVGSDHLLRYKDNKKLVEIEGQPIIFIKYGEYTHEIWTDVKDHIIN